jgi:hypothetical protein
MIRVLVNCYIFYYFNIYIVKINFEIKQTETGEQFGDLEMEGLFIGVSYFVQFWNCCIMLILHWIEFLFVKFKNILNNQFKPNQLC